MANLIFRGFIIGIFAGLLAFAWARGFGEPPVNQAIHFETEQNEAKAAAALAAGKKPAPEESEIFSRSVQSGVGLLTGVVGVGAGLGVLFAVLFAFANGRIGLRPGPTAALVAFFGWLSIYVVPALKYPANPPSVGDPDTIKYRTGLYFLMLVLSIVSTLGAWSLARRWAPRFGVWNASIGAVALYLIVLAICFALLPGINEVPAEFPAVTLWQFRVASLGIQTVLWGSIGVLFGCMAEWSRAENRRLIRSPV